MNPMLRDELVAILKESTPTPMPCAVEFPPVDVSPRAMTTRAIIRIADMHGWHSAITHFLEMKGVPYLSDLTQPQLDDLRSRMDGFVDAAEIGASLADCLPAN